MHASKKRDLSPFRLSLEYELLFIDLTDNTCILIYIYVLSL
jgi:hypothetical protein